MTNSDRKRRSASGGGLGLPTTLFIIFLILKLTNVIDWKWLWVTSPIWIGVSIGVLIFIVIGFILLGAFIGFIGASSAAVVGIKSWFNMKENQQETVIDVEKEDEEY